MAGRVSGHGRVAVIVAIFYIFLWASAYVPSKVASLQSPPLWFLAARFLTAGLLLTALALVLRRPFPATPRAWLGALVLGLFANALYLGLTYTGLEHGLSAGMGAIVASTNPLVLSLIAPFVLNEKLGPWKFAGLILGFGGVVWMVVARNGTPSAQPADVGLAFGGVLASVTSTIVFKRIAAGESLLPLTAVQIVAAGLMMIPAAWLVSGVPHATFTPQLIWSFVYLVFVLSIGASLIWFWLLTNGEASVVSAYYYLTPVFGLALGALLLGEHVGWSDLVGLIAIACGIALVQRA
jgi:drug/metabolite transporter (DMT)-like permease